MGVALGSRLGLFDIMSHAKEPMTSQEIADAAGYKERCGFDATNWSHTTLYITVNISDKHYI